LKSEQLPFRADDGWRWFDLEMNPESLVSPAVISVTEYHGEGRCLTRVRLLLRLRWLLLGGSLAFLALMILTLIGQPRYLLLTLSAAVALLALSALLQRLAMGRCVRRAARAIGLEPVTSTSL
ncbi:MAG TPA: hypothetical protein VD994_16790, partial [Prosthecobacter sp.]|nr:hypothetical protein [Prosthecobacter sp.]